MKNQLFFLLVCGISASFSSLPVMAQTNLWEEEDITFSSESLQGLDSDTVVDKSMDKTPRLDVTVERETSGQSVIKTGNEFFDALFERQSQTPPPSAIELLNSNQGDVPVYSGGGKIPIVNF